jgi:DNA repair protein RadC
MEENVDIALKMDIKSLALSAQLINYQVMSFLYKNPIVSVNEPEQGFLVSATHIIADRNIEYLIIGYFDDQRRLIQIGEMCSDCADAVSVPIRKITHDALNMNACSIILMHNHPSGNPHPSQSDIKQTRDIARILSPLGVDIDDHLIIAGDHQFSFREAGLL